jgi:hypothetical protein
MSLENQTVESVPGTLSPEQEADIIEKASESGSSLEDVISNSNRLVEETFYKNKEAKNNIRIKELEEQLKQKKIQETEQLQNQQLTSEDIESLNVGLDSFSRSVDKYKLDLDTVITNIGQNDFVYSDEKAMKSGGFFSSNNRGPALAMLGRMANSLGMDLSEGLSAREIISKIESRIAINDTSKADAVVEEKAKEVNSLSGKAVADRIRLNSESGKYEDNSTLVGNINRERRELLKLQDSWKDRLFRSSNSFSETGEIIYTKAGADLKIVRNKNGEEYVRIREDLGGGGDPGNQSVKYSFVKLEKIQPYLA